MPRIVVIFLMLVLALPVAAKTDLRLPRYVSVKAEEVNVRTGPGTRYQIKWVIRRVGLPLEVIAEFEQWRKIRDIDGDEGWVHSAMISGKRAAIVTAEGKVLLRKPEKDATPVARLEKGAVIGLEECNAAFCELSAGKLKGWVERESLWGIYPDEWVEE